MKADEQAVAGFFEDLPVLALILAGVALLLATGAAVAGRLDAARAHDDLEALAHEFLLGIIVQVGNPENPHILPMLDRVLAVDIRDAPGGLSGYMMSMTLRHPSVQLLRTEATGVPPSSITGYDSALLNAVDDRGFVVILEVRVVVW